jgi:hypothetical protein
MGVGADNTITMAMGFASNRRLDRLMTPTGRCSLGRSLDLSARGNPAAGFSCALTDRGLAHFSAWKRSLVDRRSRQKLPDPWFRTTFRMIAPAIEYAT